jgi:ubiquinone/menaquinone biosynthesis C-methylase UbiE
MDIDAVLVRRHYEQGDDPAEMVKRVSHRIDATGERYLSAAQTAALDQFHIRGLVATAELAQRVGLRAAMNVLDAGSGLGGPSRYLAETLGCRVVGVDLIPSFVQLSRHLASRSIAADRLRYEVADLLALPYEDGRFDLVWTQHVLMNVGDRKRAYAEFHRVLKPGGRLACYDVFAGPDEHEIEFPVPWATEPAASHLLTQQETLAAVEAAGFELIEWVDVTRLALNWFGQQMPMANQKLSLAAVMGPRMQVLASNLLRNLRDGRLGVGMGVFIRSAS